MFRALMNRVRPRDHRPRRPAPRLCPEFLEDRVVPAGNVLAVQVGAALTLVGDELGNNVQFHSGDLPGEVVVHGVNTTVNGSKRPVTFTGVQRIDADLRGGDDWVKATDFTLTGAALAQLILDG